MADENILTRLGKLFQNQIVVRKTDDGQVKVKDVDRLKYLEVQYDPYEKKVTGDFQWIPEDEEFYLVDEQVEEQKLLPNLKELEISNHDKI